ncbi:DUF2169 family type VI secretion system accessory protein [Marinimicrobium sp. ARAG 43.8]|uniref:DUF2169 family type VI secretion system accessory protein n=1 Tax=Marinimicrobium sp. ARAG 43.8 TaxID=3418719 RepID=UPI003CEFB851
MSLNDDSGDEALYVVVKASFRESPSWTLADNPLPIWKADQYFTEPATSSLRYPSELHLGKSTTDIIVEGDACAPDGRRVLWHEVGIHIGSLRHQLKVCGDRVWERGKPSDPEPFERIPLRYERAYGGAVAEQSRWLVYDDRNPVGRFAIGRCQDVSVEGQLLPNIEHPLGGVRSRDDYPEPVGVGPVAPHWHSRAQYAGTYDQNWQRTRAPFVPEDFSRRFFNVASPGLVYPGWLSGEEPMTFSGFSPAGEWRSRLPKVILSVSAKCKRGSESMQPQLETVFVRPEEKALSMTWRASLSRSHRLLSVESVTVALSR